MVGALLGTIIVALVFLIWDCLRVLYRQRDEAHLASEKFRLQLVRSMEPKDPDKPKPDWREIIPIAGFPSKRVRDREGLQ